MYVKLREKDHRWSADRGRYITFAGAVIDRELSSLRDKTHTVASPRNATGRLKEYQAEADAGTITERRAETFRAIRQTIQAPMGVQHLSSATDSAVSDAAGDPGIWPRRARRRG